MSSAYIFLALDMFWKLAVLCGVCVLLLQRAEGVRTVTFRRTPPGEKRSQVRARLSRDVSGNQRPPRGPPFISCRTPLTPTEHRVLDDNTHEVGCSVTITDDREEKKKKRLVYAQLHEYFFFHLDRV